jgi:hypothetical protein
MTETDRFLRETLAELRRLHRAYVLADAMRASSNGSLAAAQSAYRQFWADPQRMQTVRRLCQTAGAVSPEAARCIRLIYRAALDQQP